MKKLLLALFIAFAIAGCNVSSGNVNGEATAAVETLIPDTTWTTTIDKTKAEWEKILTTTQFNITREQGTEIAFSSAYEHNHDTGVYYCVCCKNPLFSSDTKFDSGTGWPSFYAPYSGKSVKQSIDNSEDMTRDEISCQRCNAHLGHVFNDGPRPTGLRYCMDGIALIFQKEKQSINK